VYHPVVARHPTEALLPDPTAKIPRPRGTVPPLGALVRVLDAPAAPAFVRLGTGTCVVGSAPGCDLVVTAPTVSRAHVELSLVPEGVRVRDLGSTNGTWWLGQRVETIVLPLGGRCTVGATTLAIDLDRWGLEHAPSFEGDAYRGIVGASPPMRRLLAMLERLEGSLATVLIEGESGVGKERVAHALHQGSKVSEGPFVAVNCGALPRELVGSELFGHKRGAFSGASEARRGAFDSAEGGTLFLDEIGELPLDVQPVLLRALETGEVRPVGEDRSRTVPVRIVAATNRDLEAEVRVGHFRQDLYYRLAIVRLRVPPLRERPEDIEPLALSFARSAGLPTVEPRLLAELRARAWPGNARELSNAIVAYAALGALPEPPLPVVADLVPLLAPLVDVRRPYAEQKDALVEAFTKTYLVSLMAAAGQNQSKAARMAGLSRNHLMRVLARYGLGRGGEGVD
jgi:two-component system, NtrC family, response regulator GlrR